MRAYSLGRKAYGGSGEGVNGRNAGPDFSEGIALLHKLNSPSFAERERAFADLADHIEKQHRRVAEEIRDESGAQLGWPEVKKAVRKRMDDTLFSTLRAEAEKHGVKTLVAMAWNTSSSSSKSRSSA